MDKRKLHQKPSLPEIIKSFLVPGDEWGVILGYNCLLDIQKMIMKMPNSKQPAYVMSLSCDICSNGTIQPCPQSPGVISGGR